jgi:hypothetical protein
MITAARLEETVRPAGLNFITALRAPAIKSLAEAGTIQLSLFDERDLAEIASPDYPGERLVVCRNPLLADERARKRRELLAATEHELLDVAARVRRHKRPLRGKDKIALAVGAVVNHYKMAKHFTVAITEDDLTFERKIEQIQAEALLDGIYVLRTDLDPKALDATSTVRAYKGLASALTISNGTCARHSSRFYSMITISPPLKPPARPSLPRPNVPTLPSARPQPSARTTACRSTASARYSPTSPPSPATPWR